MKLSLRNIKILSIVYIALLLVIAILPINSKGSSLNNNYIFEIRWDYLLHTLIMVPLVILLFLHRNAGKLLQAESKPKFYYQTAYILGFALLIALLTELIQYWLPYRAYNLNDLIANLIGVGVGLLVVPVLNRIKLFRIKV